MSSKFQVIIPVVNPELCDILIKNMEENTLLPKRVIIIDNSKQYYMPRSHKFLIEIYHSKTGAVNESWNLGISKTTDCDYVSILNDDIRIGPWFFERIVRVFREALNCSAVCPNTILGVRVPNLREGSFSFEGMSRREGWAVSFRKKILDKVPPIPNTRIKTFYGDNWWWFWTTICIKANWYKDLGNPIWHMVGQSTLKLGKRRCKRKERKEYLKIMKELFG